MDLKERTTIAMWLLIIGTLCMAWATLLYAVGDRGQELMLLVFIGAIVTIIMTITVSVLVIRGEKK